MHIVVIGSGRVGSDLALQLSEDGHHVVVIDRSREAFRRLGAGFNGQKIVGSGFDREVLMAAQAADADAFAAVTNGDNTNSLCARIAMEKYGIRNVVARIYDPQRAVIYKRLGIPTVPTVQWTTSQVKRWIVPNDDSIAWTDDTATLHLVERILPDHLAGRAYTSLELGGGARAVSLVRGGNPRLDVESLYTQEDDIVHFMVPRDGVTALDQSLRGAS